jgi:predicted CoA-binding protein
MNWQQLLINDRDRIRELLLSARRIAVLGIKTEKQSEQPAFYVPGYLQTAGYEIIPVPVYYPDVQEILGQKVFRKLSEIPEIDVINVFRRSEDITQHVDDMIAAAPKSVWFQSGIRNDAAAERLAKAGIAVVQDRCIMVEHARVR